MVLDRAGVSSLGWWEFFKSDVGGGHGWVMEALAELNGLFVDIPSHAHARRNECISRQARKPGKRPRDVLISLESELGTLVMYPRCYGVEIRWFAWFVDEANIVLFGLTLRAWRSSGKRRLAYKLIIKAGLTDWTR